MIVCTQKKYQKQAKYRNEKTFKKLFIQWGAFIPAIPVVYL